MAGAGFEMDFSRANSALGRAFAKVLDRSEVAETIGEQLVSSTIERFETGKGPDGKKWDVSGRAAAESGQTLVDNGHLKGSINYEASPAAVAVGTTDDVKGAIHQFGGTITAKSAPALKFRVPGGGFVQVKEVNMPARPYIGINKDDIDEAREAIRMYLQEAFS